MTIDQNKKRVQALLNLPENQICADCGAKDPRWASSKLGIFLCINCSGRHRNLGTHISFVRSCTLDSWTEEQATIMESIGNYQANLYWEARLPPDYIRPPTGDLEALDKFIRMKYEYKKWADPNGLPPNSSFETNPTLPPPEHKKRKKKKPPPQSDETPEPPPANEPPPTEMYPPIARYVPPKSKAKQFIEGATKEVGKIFGNVIGKVKSVTSKSRSNTKDSSPDFYTFEGENLEQNQSNPQLSQQTSNPPRTKSQPTDFSSQEHVQSRVEDDSTFDPFAESNPVANVPIISSQSSGFSQYHEEEEPPDPFAQMSDYQRSPSLSDEDEQISPFQANYNQSAVPENQPIKVSSPQSQITQVSNNFDLLGELEVQPNPHNLSNPGNQFDPFGNHPSHPNTLIEDDLFGLIPQASKSPQVSNDFDLFSNISELQMDMKTSQGNFPTHQSEPQLQSNFSNPQMNLKSSVGSSSPQVQNKHSSSQSGTLSNDFDLFELSSSVNQPNPLPSVNQSNRAPPVHQMNISSNNPPHDFDLFLPSNTTNQSFQPQPLKNLPPKNLQPISPPNKNTQMFRGNQSSNLYNPPRKSDPFTSFDPFA